MTVRTKEEGHDMGGDIERIASYCRTLPICTRIIVYKSLFTNNDVLKVEVGSGDIEKMFRLGR